VSPKSIERWSKKREGGKSRYILQTGVLGWGMTMFIVMTFVVNKRPETLKNVLLALLLWLVAGVAFGWLTWVVNERLYRKAAQSNGA
jgi:hypothetical protein